jgi:hypothetical protein
MADSTHQNLKLFIQGCKCLQNKNLKIKGYYRRWWERLEIQRFCETIESHIQSDTPTPSRAYFHLWILKLTRPCRDSVLSPWHHWQEHLGLIEAQAAGVPIVTYQCWWCLKHCYSDETALLVPTNDLDSFTLAWTDSSVITCYDNEWHCRTKFAQGDLSTNSHPTSGLSTILCDSRSSFSGLKFIYFCPIAYKPPYRMKPVIRLFISVFLLSSCGINPNTMFKVPKNTICQWPNYEHRIPDRSQHCIQHLHEWWFKLIDLLLRFLWQVRVSGGSPTGGGQYCFRNQSKTSNHR